MQKWKIAKEYDIVIIGAGPAGCTVASHLSKDYKILLLDWSSFPRDKPCGGLIVEESQNFFDNIKVPNSIFSHPRHINLKYVDWDNDKEINQKRKLWNISRRSFDYWLLNMGRDKVDFVPEAKFIEHTAKQKTVSILIEKDNEKRLIQARYLIGANGAFSTIRKSLTERRIRYYVAAQYWIRSDTYLKDFVYFVYDNSITDFYSWVIPKGSYMLIGSALKPDNIEEKMENFRKKIKEKLNISGILAKKEAAIILRPQTIKDIVLGNGNVMLVGEAAGLISPSTGEGISFALRSGYNCAKALNENFSNASEEYKQLCKPLVDEIEDKIKKSEALSVPMKRRDMFLRMQGLGK